ncbi:unnamed protein product [Allacma fusca]|uniref:Thymidine phosphorylase n=1 Tax=Allacma fusca TaxID=39272 RepID=A0A8J2K032_9HEXA|nr:unnamed protein product [Allacma fusca]
MSVAEVHSIVELIRAKRDKRELSENQIKAFISKLVCTNEEDRVHDSQIGAFLMAAFLNGFTFLETSYLTQAMTYSGFTFSWPQEWRGRVVDKHSTGGVGDKVSLILAPALAACGLKVPMVSGRSLDFTGGTLDKLESIPGFSVSFSPDKMRKIVEDAGCCIVGQTEDLVPADKLLYRIRDTTATVEHEDLISASVISKKAAESLDALVLDIKAGSGAFMKDIESARHLALNMVKIGNTFGMKVTGVITRMDTPLGNAVGNALEVAEAIDALQNKGPPDLHEIVLTLGGVLIQSTGYAESLDEGKKQIEESIASGSALKIFHRMIIGQGTSPTVAQELCYGDKWKCLPRAQSIRNITAESSGYLENIDAMAVAKVCHALGCGRTQPGMSVKFEPGVVLRKKPGDLVAQGDILMELHNQEISNGVLVNLIKSLQDACLIVQNPPEPKPLIIETLV